MIPLHIPFTNRQLRALGLIFFLLLGPLFMACGRDRESVRAELFQPDSVLGAILESAARSQSPPRATSPRVSLEGGANQPLQIADMGYNFGSGDAPVKVMEISDFGCGYCRRFHEETFPSLLKIYMEAGLVEWKFIPFVLGMFPNGLQAATASECAGEQERFFPMQARLFGEQSGWRNSEDPYAFFSILAGEEGLDVERFDSCIKGGWRDNHVRANIRLGQQAGVRGTPFFLIDGRPLPGAVSLEDFRAVLDAALLQRGVTPPPR